MEDFWDCSVPPKLLQIESDPIIRTLFKSSIINFQRKTLQNQITNLEKQGDKKHAQFSFYALFAETSASEESTFSSDKSCELE